MKQGRSAPAKRSPRTRSLGALYELLPAMEEIEHRTTACALLTHNGFVERIGRTLLDESFGVRGRTEWYLTPAEIQRDLDAYLEEYNLRRTHQVTAIQGRTPTQALRDALGIDDLPPLS